MKNVINQFKINRVVHERSRLLILTILAKQSDKKISFNELKEISNLTSGNLSVQLRNLEEVGYVEINKNYRNNRPYTEVKLTREGQKALEEYLEEIEKIIEIYRKEE